MARTCGSSAATRCRTARAARPRCSSASRLHAPAPAAASHRKMNAFSVASSPPLAIGKTPRGAQARKYATAIWPLRMNAVGRVHRPTTSSGPPTVSRIPAMPRILTSEVSGCAPANPKSFSRPCCQNRSPATTRTTNSACGTNSILRNLPHLRPVHDGGTFHRTPGREDARRLRAPAHTLGGRGHPLDVLHHLRDRHHASVHRHVGVHRQPAIRNVVGVGLLPPVQLPAHVEEVALDEQAIFRYVGKQRLRHVAVRD